MRAAAAAALLTAVLAGCGAPSADLFAVVRSGSVAGANFSMVARDDGSVTCNGARRPLPDPLLLTSREIQGALEAAARAHVDLPSGPHPVFTYVVDTPDGRFSFSDDSPHQRSEFYRLAELTREVAKDVCGLAR